MLRFFEPQYHEELMTARAKQCNVKGRTFHDLIYWVLLSRLSGSPETSIDNSLDNLLSLWLAILSTKNKDGTWPTYDQAWEFLMAKCLVGGDDGHSADISNKAITSGASKIGHKIKAKFITKGDRGVMFLARAYGPYVWYGDNNSMCDIARQLCKIHTTPTPMNMDDPTHLEVRKNKMTEKMLSAYFGDSETPGLGDLCKTWLDIVGIKFNEESIIKYSTMDDTKYILNVSNLGNSYPNSYAEWMTTEVLISLPTFDLAAFQGWLQEDVKTAEDIINHNKCFDDDQEIDCKELGLCVNGEVITQGGDYTATPGMVVGGIPKPLLVPHTPVVGGDQKQNETKDEVASQITQHSKAADAEPPDKSNAMLRISLPQRVNMDKTQQPPKVVFTGKGLTHGKVRPSGKVKPQNNDLKQKVVAKSTKDVARVPSSFSTRGRGGGRGGKSEKGGRR